MFAIGCIQAQRCHTGRCPTGVATQSPWLEGGLDPASKSVRCAHYLATLRFELLTVSRACGVAHPALVSLRDLEMIDGDRMTTDLASMFDYDPDWGLPSADDVEAITQMMATLRTAHQV
jgi:hypothetical protein